MPENNYNFKKLTPTDNVDLGAYKDALDFVFKNNDIKNVGITGAYSAGKSSVLESYKAIPPKKRFLHISLANFTQTDTPDAIEKNCFEEKTLEGKILNQLIHQINVKNIPQTNFRVKQDISKLKIFLYSLFTTVFIVLMILFWSANSTIKITSGVVLIPSIVFSLYKIIVLQKNKIFFKKISIQGNAIEIFEKNDDSYFDKYLNEVLYLFEHSGANVIVFEDLDRFNTNQIFQRLHEINKLVNDYKQSRNEEPLRFFFLLRDDLFVSKDRTKFFDYIIPIVPVLDGSNSYDQFIAFFKEGNIFELFEENFLQDISLYVDDMRILKNIHNEFIIYNERINTTEQNSNKLLAIILYKNLFPKDFSDLQLGKGFVHTIFSHKKEIIESQAQELQNNIIRLNDEIKKISSETLENEHEINLVYSNPPKTNGYGHLPDNLKNERNGRIKVIEQRNSDLAEKNRAQFSDLEQQIETIRSKKLSELISRQNISTIFQIDYKNKIGKINDFHQIKSNEYFDLLIYLIRHGYIDETYSDYMTYFYGNSFSRIDKIFLRSITDEKAKEYSYKLNNPEKVVNRLRVVDFEKEEALNFDLFSFLLNHQNANEEKLHTLVKQLIIKKNLSFIKQYFISGRDRKEFIQYINSNWPNIFVNIIDESALDNSQIKEYVIMSIYYSSNQVLEMMNANNELAEYISNQPDFLQIEKPKIDRLIEGFKHLNVSFIEINYSNSNSELWEKVYFKDLYNINIEMIKSILENQYHISSSDDYNHKNFSLILSKPDEPLITYVQKNIDQYLKIILKVCNECISDNENAIAYILNNAKDEENKKTYMDYLKTTITSLSSITDESYWPILISTKRLKYSADNVVSYFSNTNELDKVIIDFINTHENMPFDLTYNIGENSKNEFFNKIVAHEEIQNRAFITILNSLECFYDSEIPPILSEERVFILIELRIFLMTSDVLLFMRDNYNECLLHFIRVNIQEYIENAINEENFDMNEAEKVLKSNIIDKYKIDLLNNTSQPISIVNKKYSLKVCSYI